MSDTPETDDMAEKHPSWPNTAALFARRLERDRNEALKALKQIEEYGTKEINEAVTLRQELAKARLELDELKRVRT